MDLISDDEGTAPITINKKYAEKFEREARFKELQRGAELGLLDGDDDEDDSSDEEEEDDDAEALSQLLDAKIIHTINSIRKKDPKIYDKSTMWFEKNDEDDDEKETASTAKKEKKMRYKDVVREQMLGGNAVGEEEGMEEEEEVGGSSRKTKQFAYDAEQDKIRLQLIQSIHSKDKSHSNDSGDEESGDDILKPVQKTSKEKQEEDEELQRELEELKRLGKCGLSNPESDDFLFDYISKQKWKVPVEASANKDDVDDDEDEEEIDQSDRFESSYNFRFEEVDALKENVSGGGMFSSMGQVVGHARSVDDSVRRKDTKRKDAREKRMEKKEKEKRQKEAELRRLKNLKRLELEERLKKIGETGGLNDLGIDSTVLDEDWDPDSHEQLMKQQFGDEYYAAEEQGDFNGFEDEGEDYYEGMEGNGDQEEEGDEAVTYDAYGLTEEGSKKSSRRKKEILDELYQLDYEDIVAGIPCRFKYRQVEPDSFGLDTEDILFAEDKELNQYVGLKKLSTYRNEKLDASKLSKKRKRLREVLKARKEALKATSKKEFISVVVEDGAKSLPEAISDETNASSKRKRKRRKKAEKEVDGDAE